ncbi:VOC family protein [Amycolatopsis sp. DSM 110486]|nr:VOC family protein [Amycolatopsis sp. DSM 110486]
MRSSSPVERRPRVHLDLFVDTSDEQRAEVERLVALGAQQVDGTATRRIPTSWSSPTPTGTCSAS